MWAERNITIANENLKWESSFVFTPKSFVFFFFYVSFAKGLMQIQLRDAPVR